LLKPLLSVSSAYIIGFIPALLAGFLICLGRLSDVGFSFAVVVGTLIGVMTGVWAMRIPENAILLFFLCLIATLVCWLVTERWWSKAEITALTEADRVG
jgi:uncharacterized membrane protein YfcA